MRNDKAVVLVSASTLPLATNAATETTLATISSKLPALIGGKIPVEISTEFINIANFPASQPVTFATLPAGSNAIGSVIVSSFPANASTIIAGDTLEWCEES